jgi:hypothetical protein
MGRRVAVVEEQRVCRAKSIHRTLQSPL